MNDASQPTGRPLAALIIEDSPSDADLMVHELEHAGFGLSWKRVETEAEFRAGLANAPDAILADYSLPRFGASRALEILRESGQDIPLILVSGCIGEEAAVEAIKNGAEDYLLKDRLSRLGSAVARALEARNLRKDKQRIQQQLVCSQKLDSIGALAGGIAHDFNNLLQAISGFTDLVMIDTPSADPRYGWLRDIQNTVKRAAQLTRQLLAFSRRQIVAPQVVDLNQLIENLLSMLRRLLGEDIRLETHLAPGTPRILIDPGQMEQVIMNLAVNARDAMPRGGTLEISTTTIEWPGPDGMSSPDRREGSFVLLTVRDTGSGMSREVLEHMFDPFFSTKSPDKGTGLGLSVVYGVIKQHQGWIEVASQPESGTVFNIYLPETREAPTPAPTPAATGSGPVPLPRGTGATVMVVEDDDAIRRMSAQILQSHGYTVLSAHDYDEAIRLFSEGNPALVFTDLILSGKSGMELGETLRTLNPRQLILLTSGYADRRVDFDQIRARGWRLLNKPYMADELLQAVQALLSTAETRTAGIQS